MKLPLHIFKRMYKDFLAYERAGETKDKINQLDQDPEMQERINELSNND